MTEPKVIVAQPAIATPEQQLSTSSSSDDREMEDYEEDVATLSTLVKGKTPPAAHTIKQLLDATREKRLQWLRKEISITEIFEKYPCLKISKWVCKMII